VDKSGGLSVIIPIIFVPHLMNVNVGGFYVQAIFLM